MGKINRRKVTDSDFLYRGLSGDKLAVVQDAIPIIINRTPIENTFLIIKSWEIKNFKKKPWPEGVTL